MRMWAYRPYACDRPSVYLSIQLISVHLKSGWEFDERKILFKKTKKKKTNKNKEINVANQFFPCRDMSRDLDIPWWHTYRSRKSLHSQTKTKTFGPSSSKSKRKGKKSRCSLPFSLSFFIYVYIYLSISISNSPFYLPPSFSLARSSLFSSLDRRATF